MPTYTRGVLRNVPKFVKISVAQSIYYGFNTKDFGTLPGISAADLTTQLGHLLTVPAGAIIFVRASSPKPPRVRKVIQANPAATQQESVSTFCDPAFLTEALASRWQLAKRGNAVTLANNDRTIGAVTSLSNNALVVTPMNAVDFTTYQSELGLVSPTSISANERERLVYGASRPKSGVAKKDLGTAGTITKPFSTAINVEANGWQILQSELI